MCVWMSASTQLNSFIHLSEGQLGFKKSNMSDGFIVSKKMFFIVVFLNIACTYLSVCHI